MNVRLCGKRGVEQVELKWLGLGFLSPKKQNYKPNNEKNACGKANPSRYRATPDDRENTEQKSDGKNWEDEIYAIKKEQNDKNGKYEREPTKD